MSLRARIQSAKIFVAQSGLETIFLTKCHVVPVATNQEVVGKPLSSPVQPFITPSNKSKKILCWELWRAVGIFYTGYAT